MITCLQHPVNELEQIRSFHKLFFNTGYTRDVNNRLQHLKQLKIVLQEYEEEICDALYLDFKKPKFEAEINEFLIVLMELNRIIKNLKSWAKPTRVSPSLLNFPSRARIYHEPYGTALIIAPWNYPFLLVMAPLIAAVAAGNTAVVKPSELTPNTTLVISKIIKKVFDSSYVSVVIGDAEVAEDLLELKWDYIFFTGSVPVGRIVYKAAAHHLTPVTLELGGKNPCIVDETASLQLAAKRIIWGKCVNAGQTCIAPDYVLVHESVKNQLIKALLVELEKALGSDPELSPDFARIINTDNFIRLNRLLKEQLIITGGDTDAAQNYVAPTILDMGRLDTRMSISQMPKVMQEEIFGPILPILTYKYEEDLKPWIEKYDKPLAVYLFSKNKSLTNHILNDLSFGGGVINDVIIQFLNSKLPFGGVGNSGIGAYHGYHSFKTFSHEKAIIHKSNWIDLNLRYAPYTGKLNLIKRLSKWL